MPRQSLEPVGLFSSSPFGFSQVVTTDAKKLIFCAGQTAWDENKNIVGGDDLGQQMEKTLENINTALQAAGAGLNDIVRMTLYIVDYNPSMLDTIANELNKVLDSNSLPANSVIGVQALALPEFMIEIEATAAI